LAGPHNCNGPILQVEAEFEKAAEFVHEGRIVILRKKLFAVGLEGLPHGLVLVDPEGEGGVLHHLHLLHRPLDDTLSQFIGRTALEIASAASLHEVHHQFFKRIVDGLKVVPQQ
jgi:hypothetical protein